MADKETFFSMARKDYKWPFSKPLAAKPSKPPEKTKGKNFFVKGPVDAYCHCDGHLYDPLTNRYLKLSEKEGLLLDELTTLHSEMANLNGEILEHECDSYNEKMETTYRIDFAKRGMTPAEYVKLMPAVDSPAGVPVKNPSIGVGKGYRDPTRFRYSPFPRPTIDSCPPLTFGTTPTTVASWFGVEGARTEYQDVISKTGLGVMKNRQQYKEPLPSSRRRYAETNL